MTAKQFIKKTILLIILILVLVGALVFIIDPFSRYHAPFFGLDTVETDERAAVIGIARNIEYDTALIGSSMSENFKDSWFEDGILGSKCVKLPLQGGHFGDYKPLLEEVTNHPGTKNIFFCLDTYLFVDEDSAYPRTIEDYYISKPGLTDVKYLYNKSVLFEYIPKFLVTNHKENFSDENAYIWNDDYQYNKYAARAAYSSTRLLTKLEEKPYDIYFDNADKFTDAFIKIIEAHPEINFYLYAPPYSILFWDDCYLKGNATATICVLDREYEKLLALPNTRLFYFQNDYDLITELGNYRDYSHYNQKVNYYMYEAMKNGKWELTPDNCYDSLLDMYNYAVNYDYEQCFH